jgi:hypothetical protein
MVRIHRITGEAYLLRGEDGWVAFENLSGTASSNTRDNQSASSVQAGDSLTPLQSARQALEQARQERLENEKQEAAEQKGGTLSRGSLSFSSILIPIVLGFLMRFYLGKQRWYFGVLFFVIVYPVCLVGLVGLYLNLGLSGSSVLETAGSNSIWGSAIGALLLSSGWLGGALDDSAENDA